MGICRSEMLSTSPAFSVHLSRIQATWRAGGGIWGRLSFMKKAFSQNGRRNIAVVVDLLFPPTTRTYAPLLRYFRPLTLQEFERGNAFWSPLLRKISTMNGNATFVLRCFFCCCLLHVFHPNKANIYKIIVIFSPSAPLTHHMNTDMQTLFLSCLCYLVLL